MPARLADGLGLESDLGHGCPRPCAPSPVMLEITKAREPERPEEFGFPAFAGRKAGKLRLLYIT